MNVTELRKILNSAGPDAQVEFEHHGEKSIVTGYSVERNVDGTTKALILKTGGLE